MASSPELVRARAENERLRSQIASLERQTDYLQKAHDRLADRLMRAEESRDTLIMQLVAMKREGFTVTPHPGELEKVDVDLPDTVMDAIKQVSNGIPDLEAQGIKWAMRKARAGTDPEILAQWILRGGAAAEADELAEVAG